ncbi:hypothetical protein Sjap_011569 [Stephania japonica]|uniref:Uncharacterized protein n=1 Tax=Stephania japonica TaxID=461633 RepID=A0AAP0JBD3_9MAGN
MSSAPPGTTLAPSPPSTPSPPGSSRNSPPPPASGLHRVLRRKCKRRPRGCRRRGC